MFKEKKLDKLVAAGIISAEQKTKILEFDDTISGGFLIKALSLLAIFTIGMGVISLVASNWEHISDVLKLFVMFAVLCGTAGGAVYYKYNGYDEKAEKLLAALFLFAGAAIGLIIQIYHLSGGKLQSPVLFWWLITVPLVMVARKKYVAYFWVPLFLWWVYLFLGDQTWFSYRYFFEVMLTVYAGVALLGLGLKKFLPTFSGGVVLQYAADSLFNALLLLYILGSMLGWESAEHLSIGLVILIILFAVYHHFHFAHGLRRTVKLAGVWVFSAYIYLGNELGLFSTGIGMILSGVVLVMLLKAVSKMQAKVKKEKKNA